MYSQALNILSNYNKKNKVMRSEELDAPGAEKNVQTRCHLQHMINFGISNQ